MSAAAGRLQAQAPAPIIDTIVVINQNIFDEKDLAQLPYLARAANALHIKTSASVIRRTLLLNPGELYDSARAVESERALRSLNVFREVRVDTVHLNNRLALRVRTADGWSTKPQFNFSTSGGSITWQAGIQEENVIGTATSLTALYTKTPDRSGGQVCASTPTSSLDGRGWRSATRGSLTGHPGRGAWVCPSTRQRQTGSSERAGRPPNTGC